MDYQQKEQRNLIMQNKIIFYFIIYSFLGWCLESIYKTIIFKKPTNSGFLYGPFCPMYGIGAVMMIALSKLSDNIIIIFLLSFVVFSIWEYIVAVILEKCFKTKYWDYSELKFNIKGRICLKNSIYWGLLGVILIYVIQPIIETLTNLMPEQILLYINASLCIIISIDTIITITKLIVIDKKIKQIFEIGDAIKAKLLELKESTHLEKTYKENIQNIVEELKEKQNLLKFKMYKRIIRLKKSFPEMKSDNITKFMMQKISLEDIKKKISEYKTKKH